MLLDEVASSLHGCQLLLRLSTQLGPRNTGSPKKHGIFLEGSPRQLVIDTNHETEWQLLITSRKCDPMPLCSTRIVSTPMA